MALWFGIARRFWPGVERLHGLDYTRAVGNIVTALYAAPLAFAGVYWLATVTDTARLRAHWPFLLFLLGLLFLFDRLNFSLFVETSPGTYADWVWSFKGLVTWSAVFILGPEALWVAFVWLITFFGWRWRRATLPDWRWNLIRDLMLDGAIVIFGGMAALTAYQRWGGLHPLPGLSWPSVGPALGAILVWLGISALLWTPLLAFFSARREYAWTGKPGLTFLRFLAITLGWRFLADPLSVLAAAFHAQTGFGGYVFFISGLALTAALAHQLSQALQLSHQRTRELEKLERLGQALIAAGANLAALPALLREHIGGMFPYSHVELRLFPAQTLLHHPDDWPSLEEIIWKWVASATHARYYLPGQLTPWGERLENKGVVLTPVLDIETEQVIGGIYLARYRDLDALHHLVPALRLFASQIATAAQAARALEQRLAYERLLQEFALAGQIQSSFLPDHFPLLPGWQLTAMLRPALETSGDFYDYIALPDGRLGIVIADVSDKGLGAALYMSLSRTLIRIYAAQYADPAAVLSATNAHILQDTHAEFFVTVFYGVLDPQTGALTYCNAGHNPPLLVRGDPDRPLEALPRTGMALGVCASARWELALTRLEPGDALALYTDGAVDAENVERHFFGEGRLRALLAAHAGASALAIQQAIRDAVAGFVSTAPQYDDMTVMVVARER